VSSSGTGDLGSDVEREKEKDRKGRKNSVFGNLFKKRQKKPSRDEDITREDEYVDARIDLTTRDDESISKKSISSDAAEESSLTQGMEVSRAGGIRLVSDNVQSKQRDWQQLVFLFHGNSFAEVSRRFPVSSDPLSLSISIVTIACLLWSNLSTALRHRRLYLGQICLCIHS
jgi:hypothetical protein